MCIILCTLLLLLLIVYYLKRIEHSRVCLRAMWCTLVALMLLMCFVWNIFMLWCAHFEMLRSRTRFCLESGCVLARGLSCPQKARSMNAAAFSSETVCFSTRSCSERGCVLARGCERGRFFFRSILSFSFCFFVLDGVTWLGWAHGQLSDGKKRAEITEHVADKQQRCAADSFRQ